MKIKTAEEGYCPFCGDSDIDYYDTDFDSPFLFYKCECRQCKKEFLQVYKMEYDGVNVVDENGEEHLFDADGNEL